MTANKYYCHAGLKTTHEKPYNYYTPSINIKTKLLLWNQIRSLLSYSSRCYISWIFYSVPAGYPVSVVTLAAFLTCTSMLEISSNNCYSRILKGDSIYWCLFLWSTIFFFRNVLLLLLNSALFSLDNYPSKTYKWDGRGKIEYIVVDNDNNGNR